MSSVRDDVILASEARESELLALTDLPAVSTFPSATTGTPLPLPLSAPPATEARRIGVMSLLDRRWTNMEGGEVCRREGGVDGVLGSRERERVRHPPTSRDGL